MFPRLCFGCNVRLYRGEQILCTFCRNQLPLTEYSFNEENAVDRIFYGRTDVKKAASMLFYSENGIVRNLIHSLKYRNQPQIGAFLGHWYGAQIAGQDAISDIQYVVPVPLHRRKQRKRGYNQVGRFAHSLASELKAEYKPGLLIKTANTKTQTSKQRFARFRRRRDLYVINPEMPEIGNILLVDDVITTGATIEACANSLLKKPGNRVFVATMAVVP